MISLADHGLSTSHYFLVAVSNNELHLNILSRLYQGISLKGFLQARVGTRGVSPASTGFPVSSTPASLAGNVQLTRMPFASRLTGVITLTINRRYTIGHTSKMNVQLTRMSFASML